MRGLIATFDDEHAHFASPDGETFIAELTFTEGEGI
jgi:hypothetical protein